MLLVLFLACSDGPAPQAPAPATEAAKPAGRALRFRAATPQDSPDGAVLVTAARGEEAAPFGWHVLLREGDSYGGPPFGTILDGRGQPLGMGEGRSTCAAPDFNGLVDAFGQTWLLTHLECSPAGLQRTLLTRDPGGGLRALESVPSAITPPEGLNNLCSGDVTPWGSLLSGEEYETDVAQLVDGKIPEKVPGKADDRPFVDTSDLGAVSRYAGGQPNPYVWGWMVETWLQNGEGSTESTKRYALGRFSHELGVVMPDQRTVYLSDDNTYGALYLFVADSPANLSAGTLYAARWESQPEGAALRWVSLGHATDDELRAAVPTTRFADLFERVPPDGGACPEGFAAHRAPQAVDECLRPVPGKEILASRLESRRAAALAGATTELNKSEGLAVDADGRRLFLATTRIKDGMLAGLPPHPGRDHIGVEANPCGVVWSLALSEGQTDTAGAPIDSPWVATRARPAVSGRPEGEGCAEGSISEPDNLAFIPGDPEAGQEGVLLIAEDTDRAPNRLWAWQDGALLPIFAAPVGADGVSKEVSGLAYYPDIAGASWITVSLQHGEGPALVGVLGPL